MEVSLGLEEKLEKKKKKTKRENLKRLFTNSNNH